MSLFLLSFGFITTAGILMAVFFLVMLLFTRRYSRILVNTSVVLVAWFVVFYFVMPGGVRATTQIRGGLSALKDRDKVERKHLYHHWDKPGTFFLHEVAMGKFARDLPTRGYAVYLWKDAKVVQAYLEQHGEEFRFPSGKSLTFVHDRRKQELIFRYKETRFRIPVADLAGQYLILRRSGKYELQLTEQEMFTRTGMEAVIYWLSKSAG